MNYKVATLIITGLFLGGCSNTFKLKNLNQNTNTSIKSDNPKIYDEMENQKFIENSIDISTENVEHTIGLDIKEKYNSSIWSNQTIFSNENDDKKIFSSNPISQEYISKFEDYLNTDSKSIEKVILNNTEYNLIGKHWFSNDKVFKDYQFFSKPIIDNIKSTKNYKNKKLQTKIAKSIENKSRNISNNYKSLNDFQKIEIQPFFLFSTEFETVILSSGFYHQMEPFFLQESGDLLNIKSYISNEFVFINKNEEALSVNQLKDFNIISISYNVKSCLLKSNLSKEDILDKLNFAQKIFQTYNREFLSQRIENKIGKKEFDKVSKDYESFEKNLEQEFISFYHHSFLFDKNKKNDDCVNIFDSYQKINDHIVLKNKL